MVVYQVNAFVPEEFVEQWQEWMISEHIPDVMNTGCFLSSRIMQLISDVEHSTYMIEYVCSSIEVLENYRKELSPELQNRHFEKFGNAIKTSRSVYRVCKDFVS